MRRAVIGILILTLALGFLGSVHWYLAQRLVLEPGWPEPWRTGLLVAMGLLAASLVLQPIGERMLRPPWSRVIAWPASLWMGFAFLVLLELWVTDLAIWGFGSVALASSGAAGDSASTAAVRAALVGGVALVATGVGLRIAMSEPALERIEIPLARWPRALDGFRIVQISDIHIGPILGRRFAAHLVERVNALEPDLVAVTGDLVDGSVAALADEVAPFGGLRGRHGVFFVNGNHDHYSDARAWSRKVTDLGMRVLRNEWVEVGSGDAAFTLVGVDDHRGDMFGGEGGEDLDAALEGCDPERASVLLAHDPSTFKRASRLGIDLQISGHTHGGQIWPFAWFVRMAIPFVAGRYTRGGAELYVSRGTGFWGPPMRLGARHEITEITLRAGASQALQSCASVSPEPGSPEPGSPESSRSDS